MDVMDLMMFWGGIFAAVNGFVLLDLGSRRWPRLERWSQALAVVTAVGVLVALGATFVPRGVIW